jgi:formyltetrahydrofolate-dependent phosphoribosylglycinamide formyltransferase
VALVVSNRPGAGALARADARGIESLVIAADGGDAALPDLLSDRRIDLIVLAGYLRLVPPGVTSAYRGRVINIHPALLPAFGGSGMFGQRVHRAVLEAGVRVTGATVHFVDEHYDRGPIIAQWPVPVLEGDTTETLAARVLKVEHALLPAVVEAVASRRIRITDDGRVQGLPDGRGGRDAGFVFASHLAEPGLGLDVLLPGAPPRKT